MSIRHIDTACSKSGYASEPGCLISTKWSVCDSVGPGQVAFVISIATTR